MARPFAVMVPWCAMASMPRARPLTDHDSACRQIARQPVRHLRSIKSWPAGAHNREAGRIQNLRIAAYIQKYWRIVNLRQRLRIFWLAPVHQLTARNRANPG